MKANWFIGLDNGADFDGPFTVHQIDDKVRLDKSLEGKIFRKVKGPGIGFQLKKVRYANLPRFTVEFNPDVDTLIASRHDRIATVFSGPNNSGKSLLLKHLFASLGHKSCLLTCNRFSSIDVINSRSPIADERRQSDDSFIYQQEAGHYHEDINPRQLEQLIGSLNVEKQDKLFELAGDLLKSKVQFLRTVSE